MSKSVSNSGETTPTGVLTPSTVANGGVDNQTDEEILQRISELRLALSEPKRILIAPFPEISTQHPAFGTLKLPFAIDGIGIKTQPDIPYVTPREVSTSKPAIVAAIRGFSKTQPDKDLCFFVSPTNQQDSTFDMQFVSWKGSNVKDIEVDWLEIPEEHTNSGLWQHGEHIFDFDFSASDSSESCKGMFETIKFAKPFNSPPIVVVWLSGIHYSGATDCVMLCMALGCETTTDKCVIFAATQKGSYSVKVSWVAYDEHLKGIHSGRVDTSNFRTTANPQHFNTHYTNFPQGKFSEAPRVMVGVTAMGLGNSKEQNCKVFASNVSHLGMCWNANSWLEVCGNRFELEFLAASYYSLFKQIQCTCTRASFLKPMISAHLVVQKSYLSTVAPLPLPV